MGFQQFCSIVDIIITRIKLVKYKLNTNISRAVLAENFSFIGGCVVANNGTME